MLDVVQHREEGLGELQELIQGVGHFPSGEQPEEVAEVVATMEGDPLDIVVQHDTRRHHQLGEAGGIDPLGRKAVEVDATAAEQVDGVVAGRVGVRVEAPEVELPDAAPPPRAARRERTRPVGEGEAKLDELEHVDVALEGGVVAVAGEPVLGAGLDHEAGELRVHGDVRVRVDDGADHRELLLQVPRPDFADLHGVGALGGGRRGSHRSSRRIQELRDASGGGAAGRQGGSDSS